MKELRYTGKFKKRYQAYPQPTQEVTSLKCRP
jgi:hypothetical protein